MPPGRPGRGNARHSAKRRVYPGWPGPGAALARRSRGRHLDHHEALSSRIDPRVAHYTGQEELAQAIQVGLEARARGDDDTATQMLGKAVKIAAESDNDEMTARLKRVVDVQDAATGTVRLKRGVAKADEMDLELESTTTKRAVRRQP